MGRAFNRSEVAEVFGASKPTVDVWIKEGMPAVKAGSKGIEWQFDSVDVHKWLVKKAMSSRRGRGNRFGEGAEGEDGGMTIEDARKRHEIAKAKLAELELAKAMEAVAPVDVIAKVVSSEIGNARARLLAIPSKFRPQASILAKSAEAAKRLVAEVEELVRDALTEIKSFGTGGGQ